MIDLLFIIILASMFLFIILTFHFQNEATGVFAIILCLIVATTFISGIEYQTGANITASGDNYITTNNYASYTNIPLASTFFLVVLYLSMQIFSFRKNKKHEEQEAI